jgi:hypothetical protein
MFICRGEPSGSPEPSYVDDLHPTRNVLHKCEERFTLKGFTLKGIKGERFCRFYFLATSKPDIP